MKNSDLPVDYPKGIPDVHNRNFKGKLLIQNLKCDWLFLSNIFNFSQISMLIYSIMIKDRLILIEIKEELMQEKHKQTQQKKMLN